MELITLVITTCQAILWICTTAIVLWFTLAILITKH